VKRTAIYEDELRRIPLAAMFTALGVLLPQVFHWFGLGSTFLPMFLPVLTAAMLLPRMLACTVAVLTPVTSWLFTGMPPLSPPILPMLMAELLVSACIASTLRYHQGRSALLALVIALLADRALLFLLVHGVTVFAGVDHPLFAPALVLTGLPGIVMMLLLIPPGIALIDARFPRLAASHIHRK
jgi:hypothetical protein